MSTKNRLLPIEIEHTLAEWGLVEYRKKSSFFKISPIKKTMLRLSQQVNTGNHIQESKIAS
jgi:hypothetical protein